MIHRSAKTIALLTITLGLALRLCVALQPIDRLIPVCFADDAFYYLRIAENILAGKGPSFDGITATNGYHPLWMLMSLGAVRAGGGTVAGARWLLVLLSVIGCCTAIQLWRLGNRQIGPIGGAWAAGWWSLSPLVLFTELMGVEAPLMILLVLTAALRYVPLRHSAGAALGRWVWLGLALGAAILSRTDAVLFGIALAVDIVVVRWLPARRDTPLLRRRIVESLSAAGAALLVVAPWIAYSLSRFGTIVQDSYRAIMFEQRAGAALAGEPLIGILRDELAKGFRNHFLSYLGLPPGAWPYLFGMFLVVAAIIMHSRRSDHPAPEEHGVVRLLLSWGGLTWAFYLFWFWVQKQWYFLPVHVAIALGGALLVADVRGRSDGSRGPRLLGGSLVIAAAIAMLSGFAIRGVAHWRTGFHPWQRTYIQVAADLRELGAREPDLQVAAMNSGVISALSGLPVINLDGVVNPEAARARRERRLLGYMRARGVDILVDHAPVISFFGQLDGNWNEAFVLLKTYPSMPPAGDIMLLRLRPGYPELGR